VECFTKSSFAVGHGVIIAGMTPIIKRLTGNNLTTFIENDILK
jgi:hypothetical protein